MIAIIPNIAAWAVGQIDNVLTAAGTTADKVGMDALGNAGVVYHGLKLLGGGAILAGIVLGAIVAFVIDRKFMWAAAYSVAGAVLAFVGLIHAEQVHWAAGPGVAMGYLFMAAVCALFALGGASAEVPGPDRHSATSPQPGSTADLDAAAHPEVPESALAGEPR